jgi:hypothetical protein
MDEGGIAIGPDEVPLPRPALTEDEHGKFAAARHIWLGMTAGIGGERSSDTRSAASP